MYKIVLISLAITTAVILSGGRCEEAQERRLCDELSERLCEKWFDCWPVISGEIWEDRDTCESTVRANCANSEELYECDIEQDDLEDCNDGIEGSACGSLPDSCTEFVDCSEE